MKAIAPTLPSSILALALLAPTLGVLAPGVAAQAHDAGRAAGAEHQHGEGESPYTDFMDRDIKALSPEAIEGLLAGAGMETALPAELNGYPGPRHLLDMADMLGLSEDQRTAVQTIFDRMQAEAQTLGAQIVEAERTLDRAFADRTIDPPTLERLASEIAAARGALRIAHLKAHLEVDPLLTTEQRAHYARARGYGEAGDREPERPKP